MNMEINNKTHLAEVTRQTNKPTHNATIEAETEVPPPGDSVNLSTEKVLSSLETIPSVNAERVAQLKSAIEDGSYQIDNEKLAKNIIKFEQELPNTG